MNMNVRELRELLEQYDDDAEVRVAFQPHYPLRAVVQNVASSDEVYANAVDDDDSDPDEDFVWLAVDQVSAYAAESPYAPKAAWR